MDKPISPEDFTKIVELLTELSGNHKNSIYADIFLMAAYTGIRAESILNMKYSDIKQVQGKTVTEINLTKARLPVTTMTPLSQKAIKVIKKRRKDNPNDTFIFESKSNRSRGKPIGRISAHRKFKEASDILQTNITFNSLRQQYVQNALKKAIKE